MIPLVFAVIVAVGQASSPVSPKASSKPTRTSSVAQDQPTSGQKPSAQSPAAVEAQAPGEKQSLSHKVGDKNTEQPIRISELPPVSVRRDWLDYAAPALTLLLVIVGGIAARVGVQTIRAINQQAKVMERQTKATENAADAAREGAGAARDNVRLIISKERARLAVDLKPLKIKNRAIPEYAARLVEFTVSICGSTPADILDSELIAVVVVKGQENELRSDKVFFSVPSPIHGLPNQILPNAPPLEREAILPIREKSETETLEAIQQEEMVVLVQGSIRYQDIFDTVWISRFKYYWGRDDEASSLLGMGWTDIGVGRWIKCGTAEDNVEKQEGEARSAS